MNSTIRILGIPGSLRADSYNRQLLSAAAALAPSGIEVKVCDSLHLIPLFNEDREGTAVPGLEGVRRLRAAIEEADAVLIATPEYNQSIPGVLKNAIDWMSRPPQSAFAGKPVALLGATTGQWGTRHAQAAARHTLSACGAQLVQVPHLYLREAAKLFGDDGALDPACAESLIEIVTALAGQSRKLLRADVPNFSAV